jgi:twitching motility protein PilT
MSMSRINTFLELAVNQGGSDLHLVSGQEPRIRINGALTGVRFRTLSIEDMERLFDEFMAPHLRDRLDRDLAVDFSYEVEGLGRFRVNAYRHIRGLAATLRVIPQELLSLKELGMSETIAKSVSEKNGLFLVTGPTGSGKSTTLAAMIDHINASRRGHIVTIEDPIEFIHDCKKSVVTQREVGTHSPSFSLALRNALREDPDVILVGEMRDTETMSLALTAAETGIQVMGSLHTNGAVRTIDRIVNVFPARRQEQVRTMLAESVKLVVSQQLVLNAEGNGRRAVAEILVRNDAVASLIRSGKSHLLASVIQSHAKDGMRGLDAQLKELVHSGAITSDEAHKHAVDKSQFERMLPRRQAA